MRLFGLTITRQKALPSLVPISSSGRGWWPIIRESFPGAWQRNVDIQCQDVLSYSTVWACVTLIASDIAKLWIQLVERDADGIWTETESPAFSPVLRKPNRYSTRIKFIEYWILSKLIRGNTYVLKARDNRNVVQALYILDPSRVMVLVAPDGEVFYQLILDQLSGIPSEGLTVPATEIIHDIMVPLYHPLVGVSPIYACGLAAMQGLKIQTNSEEFFANKSQPGGVLTAPGNIDIETAKRVKEHWESNFSGANAGRVAVLGDGLTYEPMAMTAHDAQLIEQLRWTGNTVCSCYHVPPYMVGIGPMPSYNNIQALNQQYYSQALQNLIESLELCLDEGLELPKPFGVQFDLDALLRMDTLTATESAAKGIGAGFLKPNEARAKFDLKPVKGGDTPYLQQQNYSLAALDDRDRRAPAPPTMLPTAPDINQAQVRASVDDNEQSMLTVHDLELLMMKSRELLRHELSEMAG